MQAFQIDYNFVKADYLQSCHVFAKLVSLLQYAHTVMMV